MEVTFKILRVMVSAESLLTNITLQDVSFGAGSQWKKCDNVHDAVCVDSSPCPPCFKA
jgi:hypothetical protein